MAIARLGDTTLAESETIEEVEGNSYFPRETIVGTYFEPSDHRTVCGWKGEASYFHLVVDGKRYENAAWYYPEPKPDAAHIKDHIAFYPVVTVIQ